MIESYNFGRIIIKGVGYDRDVIIYPDRVEDRWWRRKGHELCVDDVKEVVNEKPEVLIVGTGYYGLMKILPETKKFIESQGIELVVDVTQKACKAYNLISPLKKAVAALHLTC